MGKHFRVPARKLTKLKEAGIRASDVLRDAGLPIGLLEQPRVQLTTNEFFAFWKAVKEASPDPTVGLKLGTERRVEQHDPIGLTALSAATFGEAMRSAARYKQITCPEEIVSEISGGEWTLRFNWLLAAEEEPPVLMDVCFAWVLSLARNGTGEEIIPLRVEYMQQREHVRLFERHFGCKVMTGCSRNAIVFRAEDAARPFITRNADLLAILAPQLDEDLRRQREDLSFPDQIRDAIHRRLTGRRPKMTDVAREMRLSVRTLQRRLQESSLNFQQMLEEARHESARHYLKRSPLELNEVAYMLGYEDSSSFVRAFRGWEGIPPAQWRESERAKEVVPVLDQAV